MGRPSLDRIALDATLHCLTGCAIGEVAGMVLGTSLGWSGAATVALSVALAFLFGYALTMRPLVGAGMPLREAARLALAADTVSIGVMEVVDNAVMLAVPGAMEAGPGAPRFWAALAGSLVVAGIVAFPVNRWMIGRGKGHAAAHGAHTGHGAHERHDSTP